MKRVQLAGGTFDVEGYLVGLERELRIDTSNDSIRLHDGVKEGGYEILNRDASDARFQRRSLELDGFKFGAQEKGILVRVSPSTYRLRKVTVEIGNLVINNPRGTGGDFDFSLAPTITTNHETTGDWSFSEPIAATGGVIGDITGDVTGDLLGNSTGTHTGPVTGDVTGDTTGAHTGDVDVRGATILFDDGQIPESAIDAQAFLNRGIPYGGIIMWAGAEVDIPETWALCDGDNGTPDLRDRFILGAGGTVEALSIGGSNTLTLTGTIGAGGEHSHELDIADHQLSLDEIPSHKHGNGINDGNSTLFLHGSLPASGMASARVDTHGGAVSTEGYTTDSGGGQSHTHTGSTAQLGGSHTHDITLDNVSHKPTYFALCFLMKVV
jgi:hypothetical protein